jgi:hypothetical protein
MILYSFQKELKYEKKQYLYFLKLNFNTSLNRNKNVSKYFK